MEYRRVLDSGRVGPPFDLRVAIGTPNVECGEHVRVSDQILVSGLARRTTTLAPIHRATSMQAAWRPASMSGTNDIAYPHTEQRAEKAPRFWHPESGPFEC